MTPQLQPYWHRERNPNPPAITEPHEHDGSPDLAVFCTQLGSTYTPSQQRKILQAWCGFFAAPTPVRRLWLLSRVPQQLFDAVCNQEELSALFIKWGGITSIAAISKLKSLTHLSIDSPGVVSDLTPLATLTGLSDLFLGNFQKVTDYSSVGALKSLQHLILAGDGFAPRKIKIPTLSFLSGLRELRSLRLWTASVLDDSYEPLLALTLLEHLDLPKLPDSERSRLVRALPNLRSGNVCNPR